MCSCIDMVYRCVVVEFKTHSCAAANHGEISVAPETLAPDRQLRAQICIRVGGFVRIVCLLLLTEVKSSALAARESCNFGAGNSSLPTEVALRSAATTSTAIANAAYQSCNPFSAFSTVARSERFLYNKLGGSHPTESLGIRHPDQKPAQQPEEMSFRGGGRGGFRGDRGGGGRGGSRGGFQSYGPPATVLGMRLQKSRFER
jgi:hypothetical protein